MSDTKKDFAPSIPLWKSKSGKGFTVFLSAKEMTEVAKMEEGGRLVLFATSAEAKQKNPKAPDYRLTIFPKEGQTSSDGI